MRSRDSRRGSEASDVKALRWVLPANARTALAGNSAQSVTALRNLGAEQERKRIARELHDRVGQSLAAVAYEMDRITAGLSATSSTELRADLERLSREIRDVNREIRVKLVELRGDRIASLGLVPLFEDFLLRVEIRSLLEVSFAHGFDGRLPDIVEREIFRIGAEAIGNAERHSGARHLAVSLFVEADYVLLEINDDGVGVAATGPIRDDAFGLLGMRERAALINAILVVDSRPHCGTTVRLQVPKH